MDDSATPHAAVRAWSSTAGSQIQDVLFELNNKVAQEAADQQAITERMIDDKFAAMRQEMWERLDEVINQTDVQRRDFVEQLAALTQATKGLVADARRAEMDALRQDVAGQTPPAEPAPQPAPVLDEALAELRARLEEVERSHGGGHHHHHHHHRSTSSVSNDIGVTTAHEKETVDMSVEQVKQSLRLSGAEMDMDGNEATFEADGGDWDENREQSQWTGPAILRLPPPAPPRADGRGVRFRRAPRGLGGAMLCGVEYRESRS
ncbi:unnamed protein product [Prorocentrum cordatum]|uniref:Uncharacterized protein n=1 Tax=Prorocentrum cordatum TaxID=2364126 RepID=A0ABN9SFN1_9DINO|nr:unnamed protein product [Polarella glacialis]